MRPVLPLPGLYSVEQRFRVSGIDDIAGAVRAEIDRICPGERVSPGDTVAVTAGSRGIRGIDLITRSVIDTLKEKGARPFIVPAMGSHGGATAEGQKKVLAGYGITEKAMGCEIRSSMDVVVIGETSLGTLVFLDRYASEADHIAVINRVKPHTKLCGSVESGLLKMCLIGLGKQEGARTCHRAIDRHSWMEVVNSVSDKIIRNSRILFGLAILQNAREGIGRIEALLPDEFTAREPGLLNEAREMMASLPVREIDLLIVDEMGKEISGTGMDTNITGRKEGADMKVTRVFVRDLSTATMGNAQGIGLADFTTSRLVDKIDYQALYINSRTAYRTDSCKIPMTLENDYEALRVAAEMAGCKSPDDLRVVWIKNTLDLEKILVSGNMLEEISGKPYTSVTGGPDGFEFDERGFLVSPLD